MRNSNRGELIFAGFFCALGIFGIVLSTGFIYWESITLPLVLSSLVTLVSLLLIIDLVRKRHSVEPHSDSEAGYYRAGSLMLWVIGFILLIVIFGFLIAIPVFSFLYLRWRRRSYLVSGIYAAAATGFVYVLFELAFHAELYRGIIFLGI